MFRKMRRANQAISREACIEVLNNEPRGVLSVIGDDGYPYGIPVNHWYDEEKNKLYFHCGKKGHKIDAIRSCDKVSFCVYDQGYRKEGEWALNIRCVITFGRAAILEDHEKALEICRSISRKFTDDIEYIEHEIRHSGPAVEVVEITPEHITGKLVNES